LLSTQESDAQAVASLEARSNAVTAARRALDRAYEDAYADSVRRAALPLARLLGSVAVLADSNLISPDFLAEFENAYESVLAEARTVLGPVADTVLRGMVISITPNVPADSANESDPAWRLVTVRAAGSSENAFAVLTARPPDTPRFEHLFAEWFRERAGQRMPEALQRWARRDVPIRLAEETVNRTTYRRLAGGQSPIGRACVNGALVSCRHALAIAPGNDTLGVWFTAPERRAYVVRTTSAYSTSRSSDPYAPMRRRRCVEESIDADCRAMIATAPATAPTTSEVRGQLIRFALLTGGPEAFSRMVSSSSGDIGVLLERTAGQPLDTLIATWRARVIDARPESPVPNGKEIALCVGLSALVVGLSLGRRP
jgi:hypothetical protein